MKIKAIAICMMLALLAIGTAAQAKSPSAQMPFSENFESATVGALPTDWSSMIVSGSRQWSVQSSLRRPTTVLPANSSKSVTFNSNVGYGSTRLEYSRLFNFTGYGSLELSFSMNHEDGYTGVCNDRVQWQYKTAVGAWTNIGSEKLRIQAGLAHWDTETVDFSSLAGQTGIQIGLLGISEYGNNIFIDNISLTGNSPAAVPEASTLVGFGSALAMAGPGMIGWLKRRRS